ncbi:MAG: CDP-alcohol phosphatidyltransferase family protein [Phycisphaerales bacterium]
MTGPIAEPPRAAGWKLHTPNALVGVRLALSVAVFWLLATHDLTHDRGDRLLLAAGLFVIAAATDALDGILARRWNAVTRFGRVMDPFADKILVLGSFVLLAGPGFVGFSLQPATGFAGWMVVVILSRELLITSLRGLIEAGGADFSARSAGKIKMVVQSIAIPAVLILTGLDPFDDLILPGPSTGRSLNAAVAWSTTIVTVLSGLPYILAAARTGRREP